MPGLFTLTALGALALLSASGPTRPAAPCALPPSWSVAEMGRSFPAPDTPGKLYVLAWKIVEDDRPLRVESVLVLKALEHRSGYFLAHLYRRPDQKAEGWQLAMTHVSGEPGSAEWPGLLLTHLTRFDSKPGNREIYSSLVPREVNWSFQREAGWKVLGSGVCRAAWLEAIGEAPTRFFGR